MFAMVHTALEFIGVAALIAVGFTGVHALVNRAVTKASDTAKEAMAAKHVLQAIAEFRTNHPEIVALYDKTTGTKP